LFPEVREAYQRIRKHVDLIYNQTVLLAGINDQIEDLIELCDNLRYLGIENHYIFHCVPLKGAADMRVPIDRSLDLIRQLTTAGYLSGRGTPLFALMTDVGKITLYEGTILKRKNGRLLLKTHYRLEDRKKWNPSWEIPETAEVDSSGFLNVWYLDGE
jgi:lysine 2,3-aminomutase